MPQRNIPRFTGGFGGFWSLPPPDLPPIGDYEAPTVPQPSLTVFPGGGRTSGVSTTAPVTRTPASNAGYESVSPTLFADDSYSPRAWSPGREPPTANPPQLPTHSSPPDPVVSFTSEGPTVDVSGAGGGLPTPYWNQPATPRYTPGGHDIAGFGGNMTLGQFLSTPLALMRFGGDRFQPGGQITSPSQSADSLPPELAALPEATFSPTDVPPADAPTSALSDPGSGAPQPTSQPFRSGQGNQPAAQPTNRLNQILQTFPSLNNPAAIRAINSGASPTDLVGHAQFDSHAAGLMEMGFQSFGGSPNDTGSTSDAGHTMFTPTPGTPMGQFDPETGTVGPSDQMFGSGRDPRWIFPSQAESARLGLSMTTNAGKYNDWLAAHNPWFQNPAPSNNLYGQATAGKSTTRPRPSTTPSK